jgi:hypothetical protein
MVIYLSLVLERRKRKPCKSKERRFLNRRILGAQEHDAADLRLASLLLVGFAGVCQRRFQSQFHLRHPFCCA